MKAGDFSYLPFHGHMLFSQLNTTHMNNATIDRNIRAYRTFSIFRTSPFWGPVLILYIAEIGHMSLSDIYLMESIVLIVTFFVEIPTGAIADMIGRKRMIMFGTVVDFLGMSIFAFGEGPTAMWFGNITVMIGLACVSGADISLLHDSLAQKNRGHMFRKIVGQGSAGMIALETFGALATGFLATIHLRLPIIAGLPFLIISLVSACTFIEPPVTQKYTCMRTRLKDIAEGGRIVFRNTHVLWIIGFSCLVSIVMKISFFSYNPYFQEVRLDLPLYGVVLFVAGGISWVGSRFSHRMDGHKRERISIILLVTVLSLPFLLMGLFPTKTSILCISGFALARGFAPPLIAELFNREIPSASRSTINSVKSSASLLAQTITLGVYGLAIGVYPLTVCLIGCGVLVCSVGIYLIHTYRPKTR